MDKVQEFLIGWLMEFGSEAVRPYRSLWYCEQKASFRDGDKERFFSIDKSNTSSEGFTVQLNQAGLDYIKEGG